MNFEFTGEQVLLRDSIGRYLADHCDFPGRGGRLASGEAFSQALWTDAADLGWLAVPFDEADGGFGGSAVELTILFEEFGRWLVCEPFLETMVIGGGLLRRLSADGRYAGTIARLIAGRCQMALAHDESGSPWRPGRVRALARKSGRGYLLEGGKSVVYNLPAADLVIVSAMLEDGALALFEAPADSIAEQARTFRTVDGRSAAELNMKDLPLPEGSLMARGERAVTALCETLDEAIVACCAEQLGMMKALLDATVEYTRTRRQFGVPISTFQVLRHRMADMYIDVELVTSLLYVAAIKVRDRAPDAGDFVAAVKVKADESARRVAHAAFQLHGGIATTNECQVGHYLKRITMIGQFFGGTEYHLQRYLHRAHAA